MKVSARDIVRLNILADVVAEVTKYIGRGSSGTYTADPKSRAINTPSNMRWELWTPRLNCKDHGNYRPVVIVSVLTDMQHLHSPPTRAVTFFQQDTKLVEINQLLSRHP